MKTYIHPSIKLRELHVEAPLLTSPIRQTDDNEPADASERRHFWGNLWDSDEE